MSSLVSVPGLFLGLLLTAPALYEAYENPAVDIVGVLLRLVIATVIMSVGISMVRDLVAGYVRKGQAEAYAQAQAAQAEAAAAARQQAAAAAAAAGD